MKKNKMLYCNILTLAFIIVLYVSGSCILSLFQLTFTHYITVSFKVLCYLFIFLLVLQIIALLFRLAYGRNTNNFLKLVLCLTGVFIFISLLIMLYATFLFAIFSRKSVHIVDKNGKTMEAYVDATACVTIEYYDYKNFLCRGKQVKIEEYYGNIEYNPLDYGDFSKIKETYFYYDNGTIVDTVTHQNE